MANECVGIDLGTTYSALAYLDPTGRPETIRNDEGELTTPSVVFFDSHGPIVGREAVRAAEFDSRRVARYSKRRVGEKFFPKPILGTRLPPEVIQALILKKLRSDAQIKLGAVTKAVITVPAYFNEPRRKATQDAGALAGIEVVDLINEPTAAAIAYGTRAGFLTDTGVSREKELVLVYDLGGGTFDATVMEIDGQCFDTIATAGDNYLGGIDWDRRLVDCLADQFQSDTKVDLRENASAMERLIQEAENAKKTLSIREAALVSLGIPGSAKQFRLARAQFEQLTEDLLERTRLTCYRLLRDAGLDWSDLTRLILVGGSTRMPMVQQMLQQESGLAVDRSLSPDEAVAHGAAYYAGIIQKSDRIRQEVSVRNTNSHDLGVLGIHKQTGEPRRQVMIRRNTQIPATSSKRFLTAKEGQKSVVVSVMEGGTDSGELGTRIGECVVTGLPEGLPQGSCVKVTFRYLEDGRLSVEAMLPDVDCAARTSIERAVGIGEPEFLQWKARIDGGILFDEDQPNGWVPGSGVKTMAGMGSNSKDSKSPTVSASVSADSRKQNPCQVDTEMDELLDVIANCEADVQNVLNHNEHEDSESAERATEFYQPVNKAENENEQGIGLPNARTVDLTLLETGDNDSQVHQANGGDHQSEPEDQPADLDSRLGNVDCGLEIFLNGFRGQ